MRHTVLVLIREPILQDKSEMEGDGGGGMKKEEREGGKREQVKKEREGRQGVDLSRAWGQPIRQRRE